MRSFISILLMLSALNNLSGCKSPTEAVTNSEYDVREAVCRHQFYMNGSGYFSSGQIDTAIHVFFLALAELDSMQRPHKYSDPPSDFLSRFNSSPRPVKPFSQGTLQPCGPIFDTQSGQLSILFYTADIRWISESYVELEGGYYAGGRNAEGDIFYLHKTGNNWIVDSLHCRWVS